MQPLPNSVLEYFHHSLKKIFYHLAIMPYFYQPCSHKPPVSTFDLYRPAYSKNFIWIKSYNMWSFVIASFTYVFKTHLCCSISGLHSFRWLNNIPLYGHTIFCLSIHQLINISVISICCIINNGAVSILSIFV